MKGGENMTYEQPTINAVESARYLVQSGLGGKTSGHCRDGGNGAASSGGAY